MIISEQSPYKIYMDSFYCYLTYAGLLVGFPNERINTNIMERIPENTKRALGNGKIHIVNPEIRLKNNRIPYLPRWINAASLHSSAIQEKADGSMLILVWFSTTIIKNIELETRKELQKIDWKECSEDFYF
ncbi:MAG: hypothetical protein JEZ09_14490 [Salinivirgaceae bacterium]|nr:hypothetical protein [Salinivirgaceae bacterium]